MHYLTAAMIISLLWLASILVWGIRLPFELMGVAECMVPIILSCWMG